MSLRAQGVSKHVIMRERVKDKNQNKLLINTKIDKLHLNEPGYSLSLVIIVYCSYLSICSYQPCVVAEQIYHAKSVHFYFLKIKAFTSLYFLSNSQWAGSLWLRVQLDFLVG